MHEAEFTLAVRRIANPGDANHQGTIFGGFILSLIDEAAYLEARRHGVHRWVTVCMDRVDFKAPVRVGDALTLMTRPTEKGRSSVTVQVKVQATRWLGGATVEVTEASVKMVAVDRAGRSIDFRSPPTVVEEK
jgi:acyl-CoA hydrolase